MRLTFETLDSLHVCLLRRLELGQIDIETYVSEWDALIAFAGWTWAQLAAELDVRWYTRSSAAGAFLC